MPGHADTPSLPALGEATNIVRIRYTGSPSAFAGDVRATIDAKLGLPPSSKSIVVPMADAPLFELSLQKHTSSGNDALDRVLPPRKDSDQLMDLYWRHVHPIDFFLVKDHFLQSYEAFFLGTTLESDENVLLSTLNVVFAFATQAQESLPHRKREADANAYFQRSWNLLHPESVLWGPGTPEMVLCLLLMGRYLQCTNHSHQAWMAVGTAIRLAQGLGRIDGQLSTPDSESQTQRLWQHISRCCLVAEV